MRSFGGSDVTAMCKLDGSKMTSKRYPDRNDDDRAAALAL